MWFFISRRLRALLVSAIAAPALGWALERLGLRLAARRGDSIVSRALVSGGQQLRWRSTRAQRSARRRRGHYPY